MNGYALSVASFQKRFADNALFDELAARFAQKGLKPAASEQKSWRKTLECLHDLFEATLIHPEAYVVLEYVLPLSFRRIDILLLGEGTDGKPNGVVIESKQ